MNRERANGFQWLKEYSRQFTDTAAIRRYAHTLTLLLPWEFQPAQADAGYCRLWAEILKEEDPE